ncbi:MAG: hypothetical protein ACM32G_05620 [Betaproteobacteria bacterium]|jgi:hypothetical protein
MLQTDHATSPIGHAIQLAVAPVSLLAGIGALFCFLRKIALPTALIEGLDGSASDLGTSCRFASGYRSAGA